MGIDFVLPCAGPDAHQAQEKQQQGPYWPSWLSQAPPVAGMHHFYRVPGIWTEQGTHSGSQMLPGLLTALMCTLMKLCCDS